MKKVVTILLIAIMVMLGFLLLTGCEKNKIIEEAKNPIAVESNIKNVENDIKEDEIASGSKVAKLMTNDYYMKYSIIYNNTEAIVEATQKDNKIASMMNTEQGVARTVQDGENIYTIMDSQKVIMKLPADTSEEFSMANYLEMEENNEYTKGKETIEGTSYYYEDFEGTRFYFLGNDLKLIKADNETIKVLEFDSKPKEDMLTIPTDYTDMSSMVDM